jgi:pimeloyl-ACP methyl ester carboxylesterase
MAKEVEDVEALLLKTTSRYIFGVSSGALIAARTALAHPSLLDQIAVFEPPWWPESERKATATWVKRYQDELDRGDTAEALTTAMLGTQMGPPLLHSKYFPRSILVLFTKFGMKMEGGGPSEQKTKSSSSPPTTDEVPSDTREYKPPTFRSLAPTIQSDCIITSELFGESNLRTLSAIQTRTLILGSSNSPAYLKNSVQELENILPNATRAEFPGLHHGATGNRNRGGRPDVVAGELRKFFSPLPQKVAVGGKRVNEVRRQDE